MPRKVFFSFHYDDVWRANIVRNSNVVKTKYDATDRAFFDKSLWEEAKKQGELAITRMINNGLKGSSATCVLIGQETWQRPWVRYELFKSFEQGNGIVGVQIHGIKSNERNQLADILSENVGGGLGGFMQPASSLRSIFSSPVETSRSSLADALLGSPPREQRGALGLLNNPFENALQPLGALGLFSKTDRNANLFADILTSVESLAEKAGPNPLDQVGYWIDGIWNRAVFSEWRNGHWHGYDKVTAVSLAGRPYGLTSLSANATFSSLFPVYDWNADDGYKNFETWIEQAARQAGR